MSERLRVLARWFPIRPTTPRAVLLELAEDRDGHWRRPVDHGMRPADRG